MPTTFMSPFKMLMMSKEQSTTKENKAAQEIHPSAALKSVCMDILGLLPKT